MDLLNEFTNFLGYLGDELVITNSGLNESNTTQVRKKQLTSRQRHSLLPKIINILQDKEPSTTSKPIPSDIMAKIDELKVGYNGSSAEQQQELLKYIEEMIDEGPEPMHGGKRKSKSNTRKRKSKSKKTRRR